MDLGPGPAAFVRRAVGGHERAQLGLAEVRGGGAHPNGGAQGVASAAESAALAFKEQGNTLFATRAYKEAAARWSRALSLLQRHNVDSLLGATLHANRAEAQIRLERWGEALADCEAALAARPSYDKALLRAAVALRGLKRYREAVAMAQKCLDVDPRLVEAKQLLQDLDQLIEAEQRLGQSSRARAAKEKLMEAAIREPHVRERDIEKKGFQAFEGYSNVRESSERVPISELPYHKMGLPRDQVDLMDNFFKELRTNKKQQVISHRKERAEYEMVKKEYRERALEDLALGRPNPADLPAVKDQPAEAREAREALPLEDELPLQLLQAAPEVAAAKAATKGALEEELQRLARRSEPTRFEQAAGELYCWWSLPNGVCAKDISVTASGSEWLKVEVKKVLIFNKQLFHYIKGDDVIWSLDAGELSLTLTKRERSKLWDQLGAVGEVLRDATGRVIPSTVPAPMSSGDRLEKFRQMVTGDDGHQPRCLLKG
ncbi:unnamed protein product [Effrenium voratum]|nr:unnamed protein product [Effrenium voratum]